MLFYIVTPTYNALPWLKRCIRSVADQVGENVEVHHHVQDGSSADGTQAWLEHWRDTHQDTPGYTFSYTSERDAGMYEAINRAWEKLPPQAEITAHLNSDEQYLPSALASVSQAMQAQPDKDVLLGSYLVLDAQSRYICHRRPIQPHSWTSRTVCEIITCSCFYRADFFRSCGLCFNLRWRALADLVFYRELVHTHPRFLVLPKMITSSFTVTGNNLAWSEVSAKEWQQALSELPRIDTHIHAIAYRWCNFKRRIIDMFTPSPREYSIYLPDDKTRSGIPIFRPTCRWNMRTAGEERKSRQKPERILLLAYSFGAYRGSETGVGWNIATGLAKRGYHVTVLTTPEFHDLNIKGIESEGLSIELLEYDFDLRNWSTSRTYHTWQKRIHRHVRHLAASGKYDIVYQVNWNQYRGLCAPFGLAVPCLAGPVGGAELIPPALLGSASGMSLKQRFKEALRYIGIDALPLRWRNRRGGTLLLASNPATAARLERWGGCREVEVCPAIAVAREEIRQSPSSSPYIMFDGGTRPEKGAALFFAALAQVDFHDCAIRVIIPGVREEKQEALRQQARAAGVPPEVQLELLPFISRAEMLRLQAQARLFASAAYRDSGGMGILEALACGSKILCLDIPSQVWLPPEFACKVPIAPTFDKLATSYARALEREWHACTTSDNLKEKRICFLLEHMTWDARLDYLEKVFARLYEGKHEK